MQVEFHYDRDIFSNAAEFDTQILMSRFRELAFLNSAATIQYRFRDGTPESEEWKSFHYEGGLMQYVEWLNRNKTPIHDVISFAQSSGDVEVTSPRLLSV